MKFPCKQNGCPEYVDNKRGSYCARHRTNNDVTRDRVKVAYNSVPWDKLSETMRIRNPICQKLHIVNGRLVRCWNRAHLVHHRISPRPRPDLFLRVFDENGISNLIALCNQCHPTDAGTPHWREAVEGPVPMGGGEFFVRTEFTVTVA